MKKLVMIAAALLSGCATVAPAVSAPAVPQEVQVAGPVGPLAGTFLDAGSRTPALLIIPGSGPTDRNGDNALGVKGAVYRQLAEGLHARGITTLRTDKRGIGGSAKAVADPNAVTIADYVSDTGKWVDLLKAHGHRCVWLAGHSEGGLIALAAANRIDGLCGLVLIAAPGRRLDTILHEQLAASLPADMLAASDRAIGELAAGRRADPATVPAAVRPLFSPATQGYLIDMMRRDPAQLIAAVKLPVLIVQGSEDLQVKPADAAALAAAQPRAKTVTIAGMNHIFRVVPAGDRMANLKSYGDAAMPIDPALVEAIANFVKR